MSMSKDRYYWVQLRLTLTSGQWASKYPARTPNGIPLSWSELFRKFNKHCRGFQEIAEVASQTQGLALLLAANSRDEDQDDPPGENEGAYGLELGQECVLPEERKEEAQAGYEILRGLKSFTLDSLNFALAYYAYALGNPSECLSHLSHIPDLVNLRSHIPSVTDDKTPSSAGSGHSIYSSLHVPGFSTGTSLASTVGSSVSLAESSTADIKDGSAWALTETMRSVCLQGMSHEKLSPDHPDSALKAYGTILPLLGTLGTLLADSVPAAATTPAPDTRIFLHYRELWRWVERLLWRAVVVSARVANAECPEMDVWTWFRQYTVCSMYWPATFRTSHRSTVSVLYLRALVLRHHTDHAHAYLFPPRDTQSQTIAEAEKSGNEKVWLHTARTLVNDYRAILSACTSFPHAGKRNVKVEHFVDLCVGIWEAGGAGGEGAGWVLDILWWATRLTFNCHRVLRHMTRILHISGDTALARRTLLLYVQVVGKAYEASRANKSNASSQNSSTKDLAAQIDEAEAAADGDRDWVETLVAGARMLCRSAAVQPGLDGLKEAREAGMCIDKARTRLRLDTDGVRLCTSVDLAEGVWNLVMAFKEQDPHTRPVRLSSAHTLFQRACSPQNALLSSSESEPSFTPDPAALYHLALSFALPGPTQDLEQAILHAGQAVEGDSREIRYWHLLGLLLAAVEKWDEAREILEQGANIGEIDWDSSGDDAGEDNGQGKADTPPDPPGVPDAAGGTKNVVMTKDFGSGGQVAVETTIDATIPNVGSQRMPLLDGNRIPSPSLLLAPTQDHPSPSKQELFEYALQLRTTQGVLTEVMEGAEGAEAKWLEVFSWVAEKRENGTNEPTPRASMDGSRTPQARAPSFATSPLASESALPAIEDHDSTATTRVSSSIQLGESQEILHHLPIPITISPATPDAEQLRIKAGNRKRSTSTEGDTSKSKKVQQMLKNRVHKGQERITTISRKIGNGVVRTGSMKRSNSTPDFHAILKQTSYQASSIHSRRRISSFLHNPHDRTPTESPPPPPTPVPPPLTLSEKKRNSRVALMQRLMADLWLMSAATFRRLGKIEQARGAIQEAEVRDEGNPGVWVQLGLYYTALGHREDALDALQKALFIDPDDVSATVHLARIYLTLHEAGVEKSSNPPGGASSPASDGVDLAAGMLGHLTRGNGWHVPEAWYYLAKAYGMQGRKDRERECLEFSLTLSGSRGIREIGAAVGLCI